MLTAGVKKWRPVKKKILPHLNFPTINCARAIQTSGSDLSGLDMRCLVKKFMGALLSLAVRCFCEINRFFSENSVNLLTDHGF
jgi:hypothetical protein